MLSKLQAHAYRSFMQSAAFQPLLDLKAKEKYVPCVTDFKLLQILGEGYEGKVLQARKKDCGVMYALKVLDKQILASRSRRWQLHASRELECLKARPARDARDPSEIHPRSAEGLPRRTRDARRLLR